MATGMETATADSIALTKKLVSRDDRHGAMLARPEQEPTRRATPAVRVCFTAGLTTALLLAALRASVVCIEKMRERGREARRERGKYGKGEGLEWI